MVTPHLLCVRQRYTNTARFEIRPMETGRISYSKRRTPGEQTVGSHPSP
jgi:hypothetical protein